MRHKNFCGLASLFIFASPLFAQPFNDIAIVSSTSANVAGTVTSGSPTISGDGRYVSFASAGSDLALSDSNNASDVFIKDLQATPQTVTRISNKSSGASATGASFSPVISRDGTRVAFISEATDLTTASDTNSAADLFLYRTSDGAISLLSGRPDGTFANGSSAQPALSTDGGYVAFTTTAKNILPVQESDFAQIMLRNVGSATTTRISQSSIGEPANGNSISPTISGDGRYIAFASEATNLTTTMPASSETTSNIFLYDRDATPPTITLITVGVGNVASNGQSLAPSISSDGRYVAFASNASNLVTGVTDSGDDFDIFVYDRLATGSKISHITKLATSNVEANGNSIAPSINNDGSQIAFLSDATNMISNDSNNTPLDAKFDVYVYKASDGSFRRISINHLNSQKVGTSSAVATNSDATVFAFDYSTDLDEAAKGIAQIYVVNENCTNDRDSDSTTNCLDECDIDAAKTDALVCGCGVADTDSDGDTTLDCNDGCAQDAAKTIPGTCGCGVVDTDTNGNGAADCTDPTASTTPQTPTVAVSRSSTQVRIPADFVGVTYEVLLYKDSKLVSRKNTRKHKISYKLSRGDYKVKYRVGLGAVTTKYSKTKRFKVR